MHKTCCKCVFRRRIISRRTKIHCGLLPRCPCTRHKVGHRATSAQAGLNERQQQWLEVRCRYVPGRTCAAKDIPLCPRRVDRRLRLLSLSCHHHPRSRQVPAGHNSTQKETKPSTAINTLSLFSPRPANPNPRPVPARNKPLNSSLYRVVERILSNPRDIASRTERPQNICI